MMGLRFSLAILLLCVSAVRAGEAGKPDAAKYDLKYKLKAGEVLRHEVVHKATVETTIKGTSQTAETRTTSLKVWQVDDVKDDGVIVFTHSIDSIDMWQKMQGRQEQRYNSRTDKTPPPGYEDVAKQVGVPLTRITMDARGEIIKREEKQNQPNTNPTQITIPLPAQPIPIGHQWNKAFTIPITANNGVVKKVDLRQLYTLENVATGVATIKVESQVLTPISDPALEAQLIQRMTEGTVKFDLDAGRVIAQQTDLNRQVIGFNGPASSMRYLTRVEEKLLPATPQTARKSR
jgi:hypothetical protein